MKLIVMSIVQAVLAVGGMAMLTNALGGRTTSITSILQSLLTPLGVSGIVLMLASGIVMFTIFTYAKLSAYVPISTGAAFLFTVVLSILYEGEKITLPLVFGMVLIMAGIVLIANSE